MAGEVGCNLREGDKIVGVVKGMPKDKRSNTKRKRNRCVWGRDGAENIRCRDVGG